MKASPAIYDECPEWPKHEAMRQAIYDTINGIPHPSEKPQTQEKAMKRQPGRDNPKERSTRSKDPIPPINEESEETEQTGNSSPDQNNANERHEAIRYLKSLNQTDQVLFMKEVIPDSQKLFQA